MKAEMQADGHKAIVANSRPANQRFGDPGAKEGGA
jgi:hypothetical protein